MLETKDFFWGGGGRGSRWKTILLHNVNCYKLVSVTNKIQAEKLWLENNNRKIQFKIQKTIMSYTRKKYGRLFFRNVMNELQVE